MRTIKHGSTDQSTVIRIIDSGDGTPEEAVEHNTSGISLWYRREGGSVVAITPASLAAANSAHSDGGIEHLDDGYYRLDVPDAAFASGAAGVVIGGAVTGMIVQAAYHPLSAFVLDDGASPADVAGATLEKLLADHSSVSGSLAERLSRLPNVASGANGGLPLQGGAVPNANAGANGGLPLGDASGRVLLQPSQSGVTIPTVTTLTNAPSDPAGVTTLLSRLSSTRAGYLDNLSAGAAALEATAQSIKAKTDNLPSDPADASVVAGQIAAAQAALEAVIGALNNLSQAQAQAAAEDALEAFGAIQ